MSKFTLTVWDVNGTIDLKCQFERAKVGVGNSLAEAFWEDIKTMMAGGGKPEFICEYETKSKIRRVDRKHLRVIE